MSFGDGDWGVDTGHDTTCPDCGAAMSWVRCYICDGEGGFDSDDLMDEDPLWYDGVDWEYCRSCDGDGGWLHCWVCADRELLS
jgi:hypothetical protein